MAGCEKDPVAEYGDAMINAYQRSKEAGRQASLKTIQNAVQTYHSINGRYPKDLKEIESMMGSPIDVELYDYNPQSGEIKLKKRNN